MKKLKQNYHFLKYLNKCTPKQRRALLQGADASQIACICEICLNVLNGNIAVNKKRIQKYKKALRNLTKRSTSVKTKRKILANQSGGFLPMIIPAVLSAVAGLVGKAIGKRI